MRCLIAGLSDKVHTPSTIGYEVCTSKFFASAKVKALECAFRGFIFAGSDVFQLATNGLNEVLWALTVLIQEAAAPLSFKTIVPS
jgi:hypothetical protein